MIVILGLGFSTEDLAKLADKLNPIIREHCTNYEEIAYHAVPGSTFIYDRRDLALAILPTNASVVILGLKDLIVDWDRQKFSAKLLEALNGTPAAII